MYKFNIRRAALVATVAFSTTLGFCALAEYAKAQSCLQWHCVWVNANTANPQQQCVIPTGDRGVDIGAQMVGPIGADPGQRGHVAQLKAQRAQSSTLASRT